MNDVAHYFRAMSQVEPFVWQTELFERFTNGEISQRINLPTGAGKTSVMTIWLLRLRCRQTRAASACRAALPGWWTAALSWIKRRRKPPGCSHSSMRNPSSWKFRAALDSVSGAGPLAISTLRGELEDNREWSTHPARPAIIVGTIDMIGSRLLFSG